MTMQKGIKAFLLGSLRNEKIKLMLLKMKKFYEKCLFHWGNKQLAFTAALHISLLHFT